MNIIAESPAIEMKVEKYYKGIGIVGDKMCAIDLVDFVKGDDIVLTPCKHGFHPECLKEWLESLSNPDKVCPCCKESLKEFNIRLVKT